MKLKIERMLIDGKEDILILPSYTKTDQELTPQEALRLSIEKWTLIAALRRGDANIKILDGSTRSCGLCVKYYHTLKGRNCDRCPVVAATGKSYCVGTPYDDWRAGRSDLKTAEAELAFLKSLPVPAKPKRPAQ